MVIVIVTVMAVLVAGEAWAWNHGRSLDLAHRSGPVGPPPGGGDYGISSSLAPGEFLDWADLFIQNRGDAPAVILSVTARRGTSPAPAVLRDVRVLGAGRSPGGGATKAGSGAAYWHITPEPAVGYRLPAHSESPTDEVTLLLTVGPSAPGITWMQGVDVRYRYRGRDYSTYIPAIITFCGHNLKLYCPADGWKLGFHSPAPGPSATPTVG